MLEILFIIFLFRKAKAQLLAKNRNGNLAWLVPLFWIGGEIFLPILAGIIALLVGTELNTAIAYVIALLGGFSGVGIVFLIVRNIPPLVLKCPTCGWEFKKYSKFGVECKDCGSLLKLVGGKVSVVR